MNLSYLKKVLTKSVLNSYSHDALKFGINLAWNFSRTSQGVATKNPSEVAKFDELISCFNISSGLQSRVVSSSYHGTVSQVEFPQNLPLTRPSPRCELADVLFISFDNKQLRITFLQAKSVVRSNPFPVWLANVEQYALLAHRPRINSWLGSVTLNDDILSGALLPSVGSFGVFYGDIGSCVDFAYVSADLLSSPKVNTTSRYITGAFNHAIVAPYTRVTHSHRECTYCDNLVEFGAALFNLTIGTPIERSVDSNPIAGSSRNARSAIAKWLKREIKSNKDDGLLADLIESPHFRELNDEAVGDECSLGVRNVVLIKGSGIDG